jgi:hypothetical protein
MAGIDVVKSAGQDHQSTTKIPRSGVGIASDLWAKDKREKINQQSLKCPRDRKRSSWPLKADG